MFFLLLFELPERRSIILQFFVRTFLACCGDFFGRGGGGGRQFFFMISALNILKVFYIKT